MFFWRMNAIWSLTPYMRIRNHIAQSTVYSNHGFEYHLILIYVTNIDIDHVVSIDIGTDIADIDDINTKTIGRYWDSKPWF